MTGPEPELGRVTTPSKGYVLHAVPPGLPMDEEDWWLYREEAAE